MFAEPQEEHRWLQQLLGDWTFETECRTSADGPIEKMPGRTHFKSIGALWVAGTQLSRGPDGQDYEAVFTLGFDPQRGRYVGTFVASMMTHLWLYDGAIDSSGVLVLDAEGPAMTAEGTAKYQDRIEIVSEDHWRLTSQMLGEDGQWHRFMTQDNRRV